MNINSSLCLSIVFILMQGAECSLETCARLKFVNLTGGLRVAENDLINITFYPQLENCSRNHVHLIRVFRFENNVPDRELCKVLTTNGLYKVSEPSVCRITNSGNEIEFSKEVTRSDTKFTFMISTVNLSVEETVDITVEVFAKVSSTTRDTTTTTTTVSNTKTQQTSTWSTTTETTGFQVNDWRNVIIGALVMLLIALVVISVCRRTKGRRGEAVFLIADFVHRPPSVSSVMSSHLLLPKKLLLLHVPVERRSTKMELKAFSAVYYCLYF